MITFAGLGRSGELGNQLFQIAVVYNLALKNKDTAIFPKWHCYKSNTYYNGIFNTLINENLNIKDIKSVYNEPFYHYNPIPYIKDMSLQGYFQSEKYFLDSKDYIKTLYTPNLKIKNYILEKYKHIINEEKTVSLHIRTYQRNLHDINCSQEYFSTYMNHTYLKNSINYFGKNYKYIIFSDRIDLIKPLFRSYNNFIFIENEPNYVDLFLMSMCKHNIISNSSFSWWGAWLNNNKEKTVIAPKEWFMGESKQKNNTKDLIPESWIIL